jgi:PH-interacting protein
VQVWPAPEYPNLGVQPPVSELYTLAGHENHVNYVQFSGCSTLAVPENLSGPLSFAGRRLRVAPLAAYIVSCSRDGSAIIWMPKRTSVSRVNR